MTSSIYVRGLGARIDQPVMGMNVDNVPLLNKNNYDFDLADVERIEILRGPQSTLYGRNTMGGVVNVYTRSPLAAQGTRLGVEYGSGNTLRLRASTHHALRESHGLGAALWYGRSDGFFTNEATGRRCDREESGGARIKYQYRGERGLRIENTASVSLLAQGGYPYASALTGSIAYDDPCSYDRLFVSDGLTVRYDGAACFVASVTSYQYTHDDMHLDQDFLPLPYFTLRQDTRQHAVTQEVVVRSRAAEGDGYGWLCGLFGFYSRSEMQAPVLFPNTCFRGSNPRWRSTAASARPTRGWRSTTSRTTARGAGTSRSACASTASTCACTTTAAPHRATAPCGAPTA